jgi:hypothetical protein
MVYKGFINLTNNTVNPHRPNLLMENNKGTINLIVVDYDVMCTIVDITNGQQTGSSSEFMLVCILLMMH